MTTPLAILVGTALQGSFHDTKAVDGLKAFAAGTFIYVGLIEILMKELTGEGAQEGGMQLKTLCLVLGYGLMAMLAIWV
jgi:zinc transporter ZupT